MEIILYFGTLSIQVAAQILQDTAIGKECVSDKVSDSARPLSGQFICITTISIYIAMCLFASWNVIAFCDSYDKINPNGRSLSSFGNYLFENF